jgi:hypothetical protein
VFRIILEVLNTGAFMEAMFFTSKFSRMSIQRINRIVGIILVLLSGTVVVPLTIKTIETGGGPWGFGIVGLPLLLPLSAYFLFGLAGMVSGEARQRNLFITAHVVTIIVGLGSLFIFPFYPALFALLPIALAVLSIRNKKYFRHYLLAMMLLAIAANILLLKWELDFGRTIPLLELCQLSGNINP